MTEPASKNPSPSGGDGRVPASSHSIEPAAAIEPGGISGAKSDPVPDVVVFKKVT